MPRDSSNPQRDENVQQGVGQTAGRNQGDAERSDRERSIETGRERSRQTPSVGRPQSITPGYGSSSPFSLMRRMADDMDRIFQDFGFARGLGLSSGLDRDLWRGDSSSLESAAWSPQLDAFRRGDKYVIRADLPGLKKEDVKIEVHDGVLSISGERRVEHDETKDDVYRSERSYGRFFRAVTLPENVNAEDCAASFNNGVLEVTFAAPKQADRSAKQVPIR